MCLSRFFVVAMLLLGTCPHPGCAQWPSAVVDYHFGTSQTLGQSTPYFPGNVLQPVQGPATATSQVSDPAQVLSLGRGGWLVLEFDPPLTDGPGTDLTVFENAFIDQGSGLVFDEWLQVELSPDGQSWWAFPYDSLTGAGLAGRTPTAPQGTDFLNPTQCGGDGYDLQDIGLDSARFVRLTDRTAWQPPDALPTRLGAEVDGVVHHHAPAGRAPLLKPLQVFWRNGQPWVQWNLPAGKAWLFNSLGQGVDQVELSTGAQPLKVEAAPGLYGLWAEGWPQAVPVWLP